MFYKPQIVYKSYKGESTNFHNVLPVRLTFRKDIRFYVNPWRTTNKTMIEEVNVKPYAVTKNIRTINKVINATREVNNADWTKDIYDTLKRIIFQSWDPKKFHVISHSSGYDSRIMSHIIMELYRDHGEKWLGDVLFVECEGEGAAFERIMRLEKWKKDQYLVWNKDVEANMNFVDVLNFDDAHSKFNGFSSYPYNFWTDAYGDLQRKEIIPYGDKVQFFDGFGAYVENWIKADKFLAGTRLDYTRQMLLFRGRNNFVHPFWHVAYFRALKRNRPNLPAKRTSAVVAAEQCKLLANVRRRTLRDVTKNKYRAVERKALNKIFKDFKSTKYGRSVNIQPSNHIHYNLWWLNWCTASVYRFLNRNGYNIKIK